jgi:hypothetical protein
MLAQFTKTHTFFLKPATSISNMVTLATHTEVLAANLTLLPCS